MFDSKQIQSTVFDATKTSSVIVAAVKALNTR